MLTAASTSSLGVETVYPVHHHETVYVTGGGGSVQKVPWNLPPDGRVHFGGLGALSEDDKNKLAEQVKTASDNFGDIRAILATIPDATDRNDVALKAIALGADASRVNTALSSVQSDAAFADAFKVSAPVAIFWGIASTVSMAASAYHGYKRNDSIGWALWWGAMGALFPIITPTIALAQGFGKPKRSGLAFYYRRRRTLKHYRRRA